MICPKCQHEFTTPQDGREAVTTHWEALKAYNQTTDGRATEATEFMRTLLARPSKNDEENTT